MQQSGQKGGQLGLGDTPTEEIGGRSESADFVGQHVHQLALRVRTAVGQQSFEVIPDALIGVELRGVGRQRHKMEATGTREQFADRLATVDFAVVQQNDQMSADLAQQMAQEPGDLFALNVVLVELAVKRTVKTPRTDRDTGDGRYTVMTLPVTNDRCLSDRAPGLADSRNQQEARFVDKDDVGRQPCGVFFTAGQTVRFQSAMAVSSRSMARRSGFW